MNARPSQLTGRDRLRALAKSTRLAGAEMEAERGRFSRLADPSASPRVVSAFNLFQTPAELAERACLFLCEGRELGRVLEPSAGLGRLYRAIRAVDQDCPITLIDQSAECVRELIREASADTNCLVVEQDFLCWGAGRQFDSILMNPPFKMGTDIKHIRHALGLLAPGGRLVSICAAGPKQQAQLKPIAAKWVDLPSGSFKEAATNVEAAIVIFEG